MERTFTNHPISIHLSSFSLPWTSPKQRMKLGKENTFAKFIFSSSRRFVLSFVVLFFPFEVLEIGAPSFSFPVPESRGFGESATTSWPTPLCHSMPQVFVRVYKHFLFLRFVVINIQIPT